MSKYFDMSDMPSELQEQLECWMDTTLEAEIDARLAERSMGAYPKDGKMYIYASYGERVMPDGMIDGFYLESFLEDHICDSMFEAGDFGTSDEPEKLAATFQRWADLCKAAAVEMKKDGF